MRDVNRMYCVQLRHVTLILSNIQHVHTIDFSGSTTNYTCTCEKREGINMKSFDGFENLCPATHANLYSTVYFKWSQASFRIALSTVLLSVSPFTCSSTVLAGCTIHTYVCVDACMGEWDVIFKSYIHTSSLHHIIYQAFSISSHATLKNMGWPGYEDDCTSCNGYTHVFIV